ncbi:MAG: C4-dicarboxylate ABC transporter permease [Spirochaetaceae bacterium]|nr:MAG: C4-dicarboxylate ABC transporter permease [Spirochaetaceae bacterium]
MMIGLSEILELGLPLVLDPSVLLLAVVGTLTGLFVGAMPGLSSVMAMAILIPLTYRMSPQQAFGLLLPAYAAGTFGGAISAILLNIPGTGAAIMTTYDGYPMAQRGQAGYAIGLSCVYSFVGGIASAVFLAAFAPIVAHWAIRLGTREYFAVAVFGLAVISYLSSSLIKGLLGGALGLLLATVGMDVFTGVSRFTFGRAELAGGLEFVPVMIGVFGLGEILHTVDAGTREGAQLPQKIGRMLPELKHVLRCIPTAIRAIVVGMFIGIIPASGPTIGAVASYGLEKRIGKRRDQMGTGVPEGIVASETANNAGTGAAIVPMITLGIPGDAVTAVLLGALMLHNLRPGPALFTQRMDVVASIFILFFLGNILFLVFGLLGAKFFVRVLKTPQRILLPIVAALCFIGAYAARRSVFDVHVLVLFGVFGFLIRKIGITPAPLILGFILGPIVESNLRRGLITTGGSVSAFFARPVSALLLTLTLVLLFSPLLIRLAQRLHSALQRQPGKGASD